MSEPVVAQAAPFETKVEEGKRYAWCACGRSQKQPFCDGSHKGTGLTPVVFQAEKTGTVYFCGCKQTHGKPYCDGTHSTLGPST